MIATGARGGLFCRLRSRSNWMTLPKPLFAHLSRDNSRVFIRERVTQITDVCISTGPTGETRFCETKPTSHLSSTDETFVLRLFLRYKPRTRHRSLKEEGEDFKRAAVSEGVMGDHFRSARMCIKP